MIPGDYNAIARQSRNYDRVPPLQRVDRGRSSATRNRSRRYQFKVDNTASRYQPGRRFLCFLYSSLSEGEQRSSFLDQRPFVLSACRIPELRFVRGRRNVHREVPAKQRFPQFLRETVCPQLTNVLNIPVSCADMVRDLQHCDEAAANDVHIAPEVTPVRVEEEG